MLVTLRHQNVVQFYGLVVDVAGRPQWLVMERADGTLESYLKAAMRSSAHGVTLQELVDVCVDVLEGLVYLHNITPAPVIHR